MNENGRRTKSLGVLYLMIVPLLTAALLTNQLSPAQAHVAETACVTVAAQVTGANASASDFWFASIDDAGGKITFASYHDIGGQNPSGQSRLMAYDIAADSFTRLNDENLGIIEMTANGDASLLAFASNLDLVGTNADLSLEVFLHDVISDTITQVTDSPHGGTDIFSRVPIISGDGLQVVFLSSDDHTGSNPGGSVQTFLYDLAGDSFTQLTNVTGDAGDANNWAFSGALSADGARVLISAPADLAGQNPEEDRELFLYDTATLTYTQVTSTTASTFPIILFGYGSPMSADGNRVVYVANYDPTGGNPDGLGEVFLYDANTLSTTQVTDIPLLGGYPSGAHISGNGEKVAFNATADLTGGNGDANNEVFLYDIATGQITQLTDTLLDPLLYETLIFNDIDFDGDRLIYSRFLEDDFFLNNSSTLEYIDILEEGQVFCPGTPLFNLYLPTLVGASP